ncbi:DUF1648 domain-containing protein [Paenibacillus soyae]|uniref:DUF1648 domain-containing protein n=1 Tax=Paenibacillus soyae TaxID=2969249 RepID=A0A9X2MNS9_9BACL|nr:DUF1648 domain-containing protein [Paenibacillus soyae]MCR2804086.1 DUF1648 domain-containing protein [Paenibacillus soyae]
MNKWIVPLFAVLAALLAGIFTYDSLPAEMAVHFNAADEPDNYISKPIALLVNPVIILFVTWSTFFTLRFEKDENKRAKGEATLPSVAGVVSLLLLAVQGAIIAYNLGYDISASAFAAFIVGSVFLLIGNLLPRMPQGTASWPKLSETAHRELARFQGRIMVIAGFLLIAASFLPKAYISPILFTLLACFIIATAGKLIGIVRK